MNFWSAVVTHNEARLVALSRRKNWTLRIPLTSVTEDDYSHTFANNGIWNQVRVKTFIRTCSQGFPWWGQRVWGGGGFSWFNLVDSFPMQWGALHWTLPLYIRVCSLGCPFLHHCMHRVDTKLTTKLTLENFLATSYRSTFPRPYPWKWKFSDLSPIFTVFQISD